MMPSNANSINHIISILCAMKTIAATSRHHRGMSAIAVQPHIATSCRLRHLDRCSRNRNWGPKFQV
jgi:hypothetical protein